MAGDYDTVRPLPFVLDWDGHVEALRDRNGVGTGFTLVYDNEIPGPEEYRPQDYLVADGLLRVTSFGNANEGSNFNSDNTLMNALATTFDFSGRGFQTTLRIRGPLSDINTPSEQGGILFGPDQDNYVKLVVVAQPSGTLVQLLDEQVVNGQIVHRVPTSGSTAALSNLGGINTLDLRLTGNASTGVLSAAYSVNGGAFQNLGATVTLDASKRTAFFNARSRLGLITAHKNNSGPVTVAYDRLEVIPVTGATSNRPVVTATRPGNGATGVPRDTFVAVDVSLPNAGHGIDGNTVNFQTVRLLRASDRQEVSSKRNVSGGGDAIVLQPRTLLDANTEYIFQVTSGVEDTAGNAFQPTEIRFTTGTQGPNPPRDIGFQQVPQALTQGQQYTAVTFGPDGLLYAGTFDGKILRFGIGGDGSLTPPQLLDTVRAVHGGPRTVTGLRFDPGSTAGNLVLWVSHNQFAMEDATDWTGKISRLSGPMLETYQDVVVDLPRSYRDHMTNQIDFGPDGGLYFMQGSNSGMGAPDNAWGQRPERLLSGALLRLDTGRFPPGSFPMSAKTQDGGSYDPFAPGAPLTIFASGVRNAYDLVWHSNGSLYAPVNGGAAGGNTPGFPNAITGRRPDQELRGPYDGTPVPALDNVPATQDDVLLRVERGGYYGHPNPLRAEYVLAGGNPAGGPTPYEVLSYPEGTPFDRNWKLPAHSFGKSYAPTGILEYKGNAFNGALRGRLLVTRYSGGDDVVALTVNPDGNIGGQVSGIAGLSGFTDPTDLTQHPDPNTGFLYVAEYGGLQITLLKPVAPGGGVTVRGVTDGRILFNDQPNNGTGTTHRFQIRNTGTAPLILQADALTLTGPNATEFLITERPTLPRTIEVGDEITIGVAMAARNGNPGDVKTADLQLMTNDPFNPVINVHLRGLVTSGTGGANEPSLQRILHFNQIPTNVGDPNIADPFLEPAGPTDEVLSPRFVQADGGRPVTIEPLSVFGIEKEPAVRFGYYRSGTPQDKTELFTVAQSNAQTVMPEVRGTTLFDTGGGSFSFYTTWPSLGSLGVRDATGEDAFNTWEPDPNRRRKMRVYAMRNPDGSVVNDAAIIAFEEFTAGYDFQDFAAIVRNVRSVGDGLSPQIGLENIDSGIQADWLAFSRIQDPVNTDLNPPKPNNKVHDLGTLRVRNTGLTPLTISNISITGPWQLETPGSFTVNPGQATDVRVRFVATGGGLHHGAMVLTTNDPDQPSVLVRLGGYWQQASEIFGGRNIEPKLVDVLRTIGLSTEVGTPEQLNGGGRRQAVGEEVLSPYWERVDTSKPVTVRQLAAYHTQGDPARVQWHNKGSTTRTDIFTAEGDEGQSVLPHIEGNAGAFAAGSFTPGTGAFGFRIDSEWSDSTLNVQEQPGGNFGHHVRFFPARDADGRPIPDAWLMAMDYRAQNYDYQDNLYLITNMRPESRPSTPTGIGAGGTPAGIRIDWASVPDAVGYRVYRSTSPFGGFGILADQNVVRVSDFLDTTAELGVRYYYRVTAVNSSGLESSPNLAEAVRTQRG